MACGREELSGVFDGESGDADSAGAGEERVEPGEGGTVDNGAGEFEQAGAEGDEDEETAHEQPAWADIDACDLSLMTEGA